MERTPRSRSFLFSLYLRLSQTSRFQCCFIDRAAGTAVGQFTVDDHCRHPENAQGLRPLRDLNVVGIENCHIAGWACACFDQANHVFADCTTCTEYFYLPVILISTSMMLKPGTSTGTEITVMIGATPMSRKIQTTLRLGNALRTKDMSKSLQALHETMGYCVQCHATFRQ